MPREHQNCHESESEELLKFDITQAVKSLLGSTSVYCESYHDGKVMDALWDYKGLLFWLVQEFMIMAHWKGDHRFSANVIGKEADKVLMDVLRRIEEYKEVDPNA